MRSILVKYILPLFLGLLIMHSCVKDDAITTGTVDISFSVDTLHFDTVFTEVGSATRSFKIFNHESRDIIISLVRLEEGQESMFRMNVDGIAGNEVSDVRIPAKDSIYVFVEVTIDPDKPLSESPFVIEEDVIIEVGDYQRSLLIDAWGQNANYIPNRFNKGKIHRLECDDVVWWDDKKPYVIYGFLFIDSCVLNIVGGTRIHVHGGVVRNIDTAGVSTFLNDGHIIIGNQGSIVTIGSHNNPVIFEGDRLEQEFRSTSGQWGGIRLLPGSKGTSLTGAVIRNSTFGLYVDSLAEATVNKTQIFNTSSAGIIGFHAGNISVSNSLIHSNGTNSVILGFGGTYSFEYTTIANYGNDREAVFMSNHFCYDFPECERWPVNDLKADFVNCIATGTNKDEVWVSFRDEARSDVMFDHCLIRIEDLLKEDNFPDFLSTYTANTRNRGRLDSLFQDASSGDFHPDSLSILEGVARPIPGVTSDLENNLRDPVAPDIGCYEYQY